MISKKTIKAIEVCVFVAALSKSDYVTTTVLCPKLKLSLAHLETILKRLKDHNILTSMRGPAGGYMVNGDPSEISIWDVVSIFEKTFEAGPLKEDADTSKPADFELGLEHVVESTLRQFTLADFADAYAADVRQGMPSLGRFNFKPMAEPFKPKAPNSVFQLSTML